MVVDKLLSNFIFDKIQLFKIQIVILHFISVLYNYLIKYKP